jgi:hypothetical protein
MAQSLEAGGQTIFRQEELDQMLAPIALYPLSSPTPSFPHISLTFC